MPAPTRARARPPDLVPRTAIGRHGGEVTIIDWGGAGSGLRIASLGCLLWAAATGKNIAAAIAGSRQYLTLEPAEIDRLQAAMRLRQLVLACWTFATARDSLPSAADWGRARQPHRPRRRPCAQRHRR